MRVLLLADSCNPDWPSLPVVGFKAAKALANHCDLTVATHIRNREAITRAGFGKASVVYLNNEYIARPFFQAAILLRGGSSVAWTTSIAMAYAPYLYFEWEAYRRFAPDLRQRRFDVVHRITPMSPTLPSPMAAWSPVPFVIGPLNGGLLWPRAFSAELRRERESLAYLRHAHRLLPYHHATWRHSAAIVASFQHTIDDLPASCRHKVIDLAEVGVDPDVFPTPPPRDYSGPITFMFVGRLVPYKCADVAVRAFATSEALRRHRLLIVGDGPDRPMLQRIIDEQRLQDCVQMVGWKSQAEVGRLMGQAHVFAFPSIRELGAGVVVEAMACGLPCVVVDYGGPGGLVRPGHGVKVPLADKQTLVGSFSDEMVKLAADPARIAALSAAARRYTLQEWSWESKAHKTLAIYRWAVGAGPKPVFSAS